MILTPISTNELPLLIARFQATLGGIEPAASIFARIAGTVGLEQESSEAQRHAEAVELCRRFGLPMVDEEPAQAYSWDGKAVRIRTEPSVLIHEVAHYQLAAPGRRSLPDFGLGAGPESGLIEEANACQRLDGVERDIEEALSSLLGILWEAELGHPAILAYMEQNWFEGGDRPENRTHFLRMVALLQALGLIDEDGRPLTALRDIDDHDFFNNIVPNTRV
ncbi:hypothetical protein [Telmatospirillum sp. J64-1]|uniref:hypothetical protein n=1 Tax=Telmatospirillum sp. J64-1 TaxID=2502183 RepID=UPI00115E09E0|nr:hypothetical protein [Telmatospirillum sp. J64-1]